ncbi:hypothetical protein [Raineyella fluvialis]|uniref:Uncharacterized protein n=1 Tax=Raineyella fluvialis TaxID=2662261 RepID=A0A5Q2F839_9ACTN|nr:hypothetical protein [Raineyella fluvialis]QGF23062.1 hypothetical protein Rai3103_04590 [Raineyella fluvialis]
MKSSQSSHEVREQIARGAFEALGPSPSQKAVLQVQCNSAHHLAGVYATDAGRVYHSVLHSTSHGRKDFVDTGHHASQRGTDWFDLLDAVPGADVPDELPAGCECGPYTLSRAQLVQQIADGEGRVIVE